MLFSCRWRVLRDHDAFPGQDLGKVPISQLSDAKAGTKSKCRAKAYGPVGILRSGTGKWWGDEENGDLGGLLNDQQVWG